MRLGPLGSLLLIPLLALAAPRHAAAHTIDITAPPYNAVGDAFGSSPTDNCDAFARAIRDVTGYKASDPNEKGKGGTIHVPKGDFWTSCPLDAHDTLGLRLVGDGGENAGQGSSPASQIVYRPKEGAPAAASVIDARSTYGFQIEGLGVRYGRGFTGTVIDLDKRCASCRDTQLSLVRNSVIGGLTNEYGARYLVSLLGNVISRIESCHFSFGEVGITGTREQDDFCSDGPPLSRKAPRDPAELRWPCVTANLGERVHHEKPTPGGVEGWVCTDKKKWKALGTIAR